MSKVALLTYKYNRMVGALARNRNPWTRFPYSQTHPSNKEPSLLINPLIPTGIKHFSTSLYSRSSSTGTGTLSSNKSSPVTGSPTDKLPRLPVPPLNDTLTKYVRSVKPLLNNQEFEHTFSLVKSFGADDGPGHKLQALLEDRARKHENWLADWWLSSAYLEYRSPVVIFSSPGLVFPVEDFKSKDDQLRYAAKMIYGALLYKQSIDNNTITPDRMGKAALDMSQYNKVLGTNRNPGKSKDVLTYHPYSRHFVVAYKNYYYKVPAFGDDGKVIDPVEILRQLKFIVEVTSGLNGQPIGILTSEHRDTWGSVYEAFRKDKQNQSSMKVIEEALFLVSIDRPNRPLKSPKGSVNVPGVEDLVKSEKQTVAALQMIHGNRTNSGNRWFDKTIQFIVGSEGECGLTYEHSPAEGPPIANLMDFILNNLNNYEPLLQKVKESTQLQDPVRLPFNVTEKFSENITSASNNLGNLIDDLDMACFTFKKYGKDYIKTCKFSPDSYIQMAIQTAFHRVHGIPCAHYESASTRMYAGGRTETIRSCSSESLEFSKALNDPKASVEHKFETMKKAIEGHKFYAAQAVSGFGVDRHLLGLKLVAKENGLPVPEIFSDKGYAISTHFRLSTSQVPSVNEAFMCYGPLVPDGYGCCYSPRNNDMSFGISAFNADPTTNAGDFKLALQEVLLDMQKVTAQNIQSKL